jgi:hypothetical protein
VHCANRRIEESPLHRLCRCVHVTCAPD